MTIEWKFTYKKNGIPKTKNAGRSQHKVYVILDKPLRPIEIEENEVFLTVLHLATSNSGAENDADAVWNTWQLFAEIKNPQDKYRSEALAVGFRYLEISA